MAISKTTIATGILSTGTGVAGTTLVVKYTTSKSESSKEQNKENSSAASTTTKEPEATAESDLTTVKSNINTWSSSSEGCSIKVKLTGDSEQNGKELNDISDANQKTSLEALYSKLSSTEATAGTSNPKTLCTEIKKDTNKFLLAIQGDGNSWTFSEKTNQ